MTRLLICTQAVDLDDPILGFFHRWIEEFAICFENIEVVCLREGTHHLPANVRVHTLGKPREARYSLGIIARIGYTLRFYKFIWQLRARYDAVFVHMNEEYVVLAGVAWRLLGKKIVLWRNYLTGTYLTPIASFLAHRVCYTSPQSFTARYAKAVQMPLGIDVEAFVNPLRPRERNSVLFLGRLDPVKQVDIFLKALNLLLERGVSDWTAYIYGSPSYPDSSYVRGLCVLAKPLIEAHRLTMQSAIPHREIPSVFSASDLYVNLTPPGSFDKTIGEAMVAGCVVLTANDAVEQIVNKERIVDGKSAESVSQGIRRALSLSEEARVRVRLDSRAYIEKKQSLVLLAERLRDLCR